MKQRDTYICQPPHNNSYISSTVKEDTYSETHKITNLDQDMHILSEVKIGMPDREGNKYIGLIKIIETINEKEAELIIDTKVFILQKC